MNSTLSHDLDVGDRGGMPSGGFGYLAGKLSEILQQLVGKFL